MDRTILHCDCNAFFASVEEMLRPELRDVPMAVAGDPHSRHGIILAKNERAKRFGVKTAETIWQARAKCPDLVCVPAHHDEYSAVSRKINAIYLGYTDLVEPFSIDESFLDITGSLKLLGKGGRQTADELRARIRGEIGLTISVGVSFCKVFAKLGSDYKKPDATTVFSRENFRALVWPLPVEDLLFVGGRSAQALHGVGIHTIGDAAAFPEQALVRLLGSHGKEIHDSANGIDDDPVRSFYEPREVKSIGNSMTFRRDLTGRDEIHAGLAVLSDSVSARLRAAGKKCTVIQTAVKAPDLTVKQHQKKLAAPTMLQKEITDTAMALVLEMWDPDSPVRLLSVTAAGLVDAQDGGQLSLFDGAAGSGRQEKIEDAMAGIRARFGKGAIGFGYCDNEDLGIRRD